MVNKYVILANSNDNKFEIPRQLLEVNGEKLVCRTIRLLKENGVKDIIMTASDDRFKGLGAKIYKPSKSDYDYTNESGYWLNAFPYELMEEPVCFIWGDVYFSENAIKTIVETESDKNLFFCSYNNDSIEYIKHHDEPFAFKVVNADEFKKHIDICKKAKDENTCIREPVIWEVYRSMHGIDINEHIMTEDYVAINDISCDIDNERDLDKLNLKLNNNYKYKLSLIIAYYKTYDYVTKILDTLIPQLNANIEVLLIDDGCNETRLDKYKEINIIHLKENKGGAGAMNVGILNSKGKYIGFIDSDDMISNDYVETLLNKINSCDADTIFMDWQDMETKEIHKRPDNYAQWKCIYKRKIIPMFVDGRKYSFDVPFYDELNSKKYTKEYVDKVLYFYNSGNPNNLTHQKEEYIKSKTKKGGIKMIKVEVIERFTLADYKKLKNVEKVVVRKENEFGVGDTFECDKEMADYLTGNNAFKKEVVKVIEVKPKIINKNNVIEKLEEAQEKILKDEAKQTISIVDKNGVVVGKIEKPKKTRKTKTNKK